MKKLIILTAMVFLLILGCGKKKESKKAPDLNTETTQESYVDTTYTPDEETSTEDESIQDETNESKPEVKEYKFIPKGTEDFKAKGKYAVQIISLTDYDKILKIKRTLSEYGYETELSTIDKNGKTFYRLRLKEKYTKEAAKEAGEEIKNRFKFITGYWIQKTK